VHIGGRTLTSGLPVFGGALIHSIGTQVPVPGVAQVMGSVTHLRARGISAQVLTIAAHIPLVRADFTLVRAHIRPVVGHLSAIGAHVSLVATDVALLIHASALRCIVVAQVAFVPADILPLLPHITSVGAHVGPVVGHVTFVPRDVALQGAIPVVIPCVIPVVIPCMIPVVVPMIPVVVPMIPVIIAVGTTVTVRVGVLALTWVPATPIRRAARLRRGGRLLAVLARYDISLLCVCSRQRRSEN
jgi:hypothetical protein